MKTLTYAVLIAIASLGCDTSDPTAAVVTNGYPRPPDGGEATQTVVWKAWWSVALFADPIPAGIDSDPARVVPASDYAYAILAPNWDPSSGAPPSTLIPVRTRDKASAPRGETLHITIADGTIIGHCAAGEPLSQDDADFITQRIFPGDFANVTYDASTCIATPRVADAGVDAESDGPSDSASGDSG
jgi:hypothetical protein